ncbi:uncharacterized protein N7446_005187 [Penicillium canescens]|uniref:uncharacterized protein n=1 Tax=Penicillium canescens TaxID=5083 RepID=UPI0026E0D989|nr:uncharacterized protein N7446_005187 [Penicillium canescens]KAJ6068150.1 hypothetical protein N7446_005187 [Penicillium canescens]
MKRDHYGLAEEYISDYQRQVNILRRSKIAPPAFISIGIMIRELQDKLPDMVFTREALRKVKESHEITHEDFDKQCKEMTIKARQLAVKANKTHSARRNPFRTDRQDKNTTVVAEPSNQNNQNRGRGRGDGRNGRASPGEHADHRSSTASTGARGAPPRGKDIYKYARECCEAEKQRINDRCSFCGYGPHNAKHCSYLQEAPECDWVLSSAVWSLSSAIRDRNEKQGRVSLAIQTYMAESPTTLPTPKATELAIEELNPKPVGKPSLTHLRPWGCITYVHIPKSKRVQSRKIASSPQELSKAI